MMVFFRTVFPVAALCTLAFPSSAVAQYVGTTVPLFPTIMVPMFPGGNTVPFTGQSARHAPPRAENARPALGTTLLANGPSRIDANAIELATHFPPEVRAKMRTTYLQSFDTFKKFERKLALPDNDVANGVSAYIAGNYMILNSVEVADPDFLKMVSQVRRGLMQSQGFQQVPAAQKRKLYEQTAMVGMFMAVAQLSLKTVAANPETLHRLQDSAQSNLELIFGTPASNLRIDSEGMHLR